MTDTPAPFPPSSALADAGASCSAAPSLCGPTSPRVGAEPAARPLCDDNPGIALAREITRERLSDLGLALQKDQERRQGALGHADLTVAPEATADLPDAPPSCDDARGDAVRVPDLPEALAFEVGEEVYHKRTGEVLGRVVGASAPAVVVEYWGVRLPLAAEDLERVRPAGALPRVVAWSALRPGDLAFDAGADAGTCALLLVRESGRGQWRDEDDGCAWPSAPTIAFDRLVGRTCSDPANNPRAERAVLVARGVRTTARSVLAAWTSAEAKARALAAEARKAAS